MSIEMHRSDDNLEVTQKFSEKRTTTKATVGAAKKKVKKRSRSRSSKRAATPLNERPMKLKVLPDTVNKSYESI